MIETRTLGKVVSAEVRIYKGPCHFADADFSRITYNDVLYWRIISGPEARKLESNMSPSEIDEFHTYCRIYFADGSKATYRNTHILLIIPEQ
jgi:hypothetical protein